MSHGHQHGACWQQDRARLVQARGGSLLLSLSSAGRNQREPRKASTLGRIRGVTPSPLDAEQPVGGQANSCSSWDSYRIIGQQPEGSFFGEHTCLLGTKRVATVVALSFCELHSLNRSSLERMSQQWPELVDDILSLLDRYVSTMPHWCQGLGSITRHVQEQVHFHAPPPPAMRTDPTPLRSPLLSVNTSQSNLERRQSSIFLVNTDGLHRL